MRNPRRLPLLLAPVLVLAACGPVLGQAGDIPTATPVAPPSGQRPTVTAGKCPDPADTPQAKGSFQLADGPSWARICGTSNSGTGQEPGLDGGRVLLGPPDALVTNLDGLVAFANALPTADSNMACTMELGPSYTLVVGYPDGRTQQITGELFGCRMVGDRTGSQQLLDDFGNRLRAQRIAFPDLAPIAETCADAKQVLGDLFVQPTLEQTLTAYVSSLPVNYDDRELRKIAEWPKLLEKLLADAEPYDPRPDPTSDTTSFGPAVSIEAVNAQCETLILQATEEGVIWAEPGSHQQFIWVPDADGSAILEPYLEFAAPPK